MSDLLPSVVVEAKSEHRATVIWLHGLGDSGNGFAPIVPALNIPDELGVKFIFPHAPNRAVTINNGMLMRAWYDIKSMDFNSRADMPGVLESAEQVKALIDAEIASGIPARDIVLAGFSQGGVIAYHLGLRLEEALAGIMCLSTYMAEPESLAQEHSQISRIVPIMVAHGSHDDVVPVTMGKAAFARVNELGYNAKWHEYPMQHNVCPEEVGHISQWLQKVLAP
ncbi:MAG: alpha/beta hydrolase [Glaciecola sp.]|nr:alpha/beta hydrolase [Glaciecola sp.]